MKRTIMLLTVAVMMVASVGAPASAQQGSPTGDLSVVGEVTVNYGGLNDRLKDLPNVLLIETPSP
jgi:hypothetical protein